MDSSDERIDFLKEAINDTQNTIRFADSKALAVVGFWTFFITVVTFRIDNLWKVLYGDTLHWTEVFLISTILTVMTFQMIVALHLAYSTLVPKTNPAKHVNLGNKKPRNLYFINGYQGLVSNKFLFFINKELKLKKSLEEYTEELNSLDSEGLQLEYAYELQKVSFIRSIKMDRVDQAISILKKFILLCLSLSLYLVGKKVLGGMEIVDASFNLELDVALFITLYIGHKIGDYVIQTDYQAKVKSERWLPLIIHCVTYSIALFGIAYIVLGYFNWLAIFIVLFSHVVIDKGDLLKWWAHHIKRIKNVECDSVKIGIFELDQSFHYFIIFIVSIIPHS